MGTLSRLTSGRAALKRTISQWIRHAAEWARLIEPIQIAPVVSPNHPDIDALPEGVLYVVGGEDYKKWAFLVCPCGCRERIMLSLSANRRPRWQVEIDWLGRPTVKPSVWQTDGCYSHFWIRKGAIHWTADTGTPHRSRVANES